MKKVFLVLLAVAVLLTATAALWQFVPLFGVSWEDFLLRLEFYTYTAEPLMEGISFPCFDYCPAYSSRDGYPVVMAIPNETGDGYDTEITVTLRAEYGSWINDYHYPTGEHTYADLGYHLGNPVTIRNGGTLYWNDNTYDLTSGECINYHEFFLSDKDVCFVDGLVRKDGHIIGYFVIRFQVMYTHEHGRQKVCVADTVGSASFPMIDGEYQDISPECIEAKIQQIKDSTQNIPRYYYEAEDN